MSDLIPGPEDRVFHPQPCWLEDAIAESVAEMESLPPGIRAALDPPYLARNRRQPLAGVGVTVDLTPGPPEDQERGDGPMYVIIEHRPRWGGYRTYYARPYDNLDGATEKVVELREIALAGGRTEDTYEVYELRKVRPTSAGEDNWSDEAADAATRHLSEAWPTPIGEDQVFAEQIGREAAKVIWPLAYLAGREDAAKEKATMLDALRRLRDFWYGRPGWTDAADTVDVLIDAFAEAQR